MKIPDIKVVYAQLIDHEGLRLKPYKDTVGKLTIGVGRNLDDVGISEEEAMILLGNDVQKAADDIEALVPNVGELEVARQLVLIDMAFNLGRTRLAKFRRMLAAVRAVKFEEAADEMVNSRWYQQVGRRAVKLERQMRTGEP